MHDEQSDPGLDELKIDDEDEPTEPEAGLQAEPPDDTDELMDDEPPEEEGGGPQT